MYFFKYRTIDPNNNMTWFYNEMNDTVPVPIAWENIGDLVKQGDDSDFASNDWKIQNISPLPFYFTVSG